MRVLLIFLMVGTLTFPLAGQNISGRAFYTSMYKFEDTELSAEQLQDPRAKAWTEQFKKPFIDQYELEFTENESVFKKLPKLDKPEPNKDGIQISMSLMGEDEILYKNLNGNFYLNDSELYGKKFLISDTLKNAKWKLEKESKTIGHYVCFKATYEKKPDNPDTLSTEEPEVVTAWYTPQIPVKNGPKEYDGLPGLILEVHDGHLKMVCTKVVLNPTEIVQIKAPSKGKKVSQTEFKSIMRKKNEEQMDFFRRKKSRD